MSFVFSWGADPPPSRAPGECPDGLVFVLATSAGDVIDVVRADASAAVEAAATAHGAAVSADPTLLVFVYDGDSGEPVCRLRTG